MKHIIPFFLICFLILPISSFAKDIKVSGEGGDNPYGGGYIRLKAPQDTGEEPNLPEQYIQRTPEKIENKAESLNAEGDVTLQRVVQGTHYTVTDPYACIRQYGGAFVTSEQVSYEEAFQTCQKLKQEKEQTETAPETEEDAVAEEAAPEEDEKETKKKGFFGKIKSAFAGDGQKKQKKGLNE